jgi:hypothetical protein
VPDIATADIVGTFGAVPFALVEPGSAELVHVPAGWRPIVAAADARTRRASALALWNGDFTDMVPRFWSTLAAHLVDVRVATLDDLAVLVYVVTNNLDEYIAWIGWDPATFGEPPIFWDRFPAPMQTFLREVHAGFTAATDDVYGPMAPRTMETLAARSDEPDGLADWDDTSEIRSTRLLVIMANAGTVLYCVSPDIPRGQVALVYEGDIDPVDLGAAMDELMVAYLD